MVFSPPLCALSFTSVGGNDERPAGLQVPIGWQDLVCVPYWFFHWERVAESGFELEFSRDHRRLREQVSDMELTVSQ